MLKFDRVIYKLAYNNAVKFANCTGIWSVKCKRCLTVCKYKVFNRSTGY